MQYKHNPGLTSHAKELRNHMTKEERHLWYDFLKAYPIRFPDKKCWENILLTFTVQKHNLLLNWMDLSIMKQMPLKRMLKELPFWRIMV